MSPTQRLHGPRARAGLSLVELLVALSVLTVGALALAGVTGRMMAASNAAARATRAAELLDARAESLHVAPCADAGGEREDGALRERWRVRLDGELLTLSDTVTYSLPGREPRAVGLTAARWCAP